MPSSNIKLFDVNKENMMSDTAYDSNEQRLNGVQSGIASSQLQNKTLYQTALVSYAIAQLMLNNGLDANDTDVVTTFVSNLNSSILQKVADKATTEEAQAGTNDTKWVTPLMVKTVMDALKATSGQAQAGTDNTHWMTPSLVKTYVDGQLATDAEAKAYTNNTHWMSPLRTKAAIDGMLPISIANGGTGQTTAAAARNALGLGNTTGAVPVANGGTGATTAANARTNLGLGGASTYSVKDNTSSAALSTGTGLTTERAVKYNSDARLNRSTNVNAADANYTTYMARGEALNSSDTNPTANGAISWTYA